MPSKPVKKPRRAPVPAPLAPSTARHVKQKVARIVAAAKEDIRLILRRKADTVEALYDIGEALLRLKRPEVAPALGYKGFAEMVEATVKISGSQAADLVQMVQRVKREDAIAMGKSRALALVDLSDVTPEADTAASIHRRRKVALPGGQIVDVESATVRELRRATKVARSKAKAPARGSHVSEEELARAAALQAKLRTVFPEAKVTAVAGPPRHPTKIRVEGVPLASVREMGRLLAR